MRGRAQTRIRLLAGAVALALLVPATGSAGIIEDATAPAGTVAVAHDDRANALIRLDVPATDDLTGVTTVEVSGNSTTWASFAYAPQVDWAVFDPAAGGATGMGNRTVRVRWTDGAGNVSAPITTTLYLSLHGALEYPIAPVTGSPFTIRPIYGAGETPPSNGTCSWEVRWGDTEALRDNLPNETFGSMYLSGKPDRGFCGPWTFDLPWVPVRQFELYFNSPVMSSDDGDWDDRAKFYPALGSTDRRIDASNLPLVQVLPDRYTLVVGEPITYRAYPIGTTLRSDDTWIAYCPNFSCPGGGIAYKIKYGGSTFTFTPPVTGTWLITWNGTGDRPIGLNATYDPRARNPDTARPNTTAPVQKIGGGTPAGTVPVTIEWSGSDVGWGIETFRLQRSMDGGAWQSVGLPTAKTKSVVQQLATDHTFRYRVRAIDRAGNKGAWDEGPSFRTRLVGDMSASIIYTGTWDEEADATALGGGLHRSDDGGAWAKLRFTGRDVAWIVEKGPGKGRAMVYVDGDLEATVDLAAGSDVARQIVIRRHWSTRGEHVIKIVVEGTIGRPTITLDAFAILR